MKPVPDFLLIGAAKAGTSAFFEMLCSHPGVFRPPVKEPLFYALAGQPPQFAPGPYNEVVRSGAVWERSRYEQLFSGAGGLLTGEASTIYLGSRSAARAVGRELPEARAIAVLRDPVDRAYSAYLHLRRDGWEPLADFAEALAAEPDRIERGYAPLWLYRSRGMYGEQLEDWLEAVGERRLLLLRYDELLREPVATVRSAWRFLGLDDSGTPSVTRLNPAGQVRSARLRDALIRPSGAKRLSRRLLPAAARRRAWRALMTRNTRPTEQRIEERVADRLRASFQSDIERVEMLTGWDLGSWKTGSPR